MFLLGGICAWSHVPSGGICAWSHVPPMKSLSRRVSVKGRGSLSRGRALSPGEGVSVQGRGSLSGGVSVQGRGSLSRGGGLCPGSLCLGPPCTSRSSRAGGTSRWYVSYWNAFLFRK